MTNKKITEAELRDKVASLREHMNVVTNGQINEWGSAEDWGKAVGGGLGAAAGGFGGGATGATLGPVGAATGAVVGGAAGHDVGAKYGGQAGKWLGDVSDRLGKAWDAASSSWDKSGQAAAKPATTKPTATGKSDPAVLKQQQELIAKGAKIKADGIMGPATQAAIKQFGGQGASATTATVPSSKPDATPAAPETPAAPTYSPNNPHVAKPDTAKQDAWEKLSPEQQKWLGNADPTDPIILSRMRAAVPDAAQGAATSGATKPSPYSVAPTGGTGGFGIKVPGLTPQQQAQNVMQPGTNKVQENVTFSNEDSLARIIQLSR